MKIRKNMVMRIVSAATIMCIAISMAVFPSYAVNLGGVSSRGNIVLEDGEVSLYASDMEFLQDELKDLYSELPETEEPAYISATRKSKIESRGIIDYAGGTVILDSTDLTYLADEIDELEALYKQEILKALNEINTYYEDYENIVHEENTTDIPTLLSLEQLKDGILNSQTVETGTIADNLSIDKGAWVNGEYIEGNGADNQAAYNQGYTDGFNKAMDGADISYVYHEHEGTPYVTGGCINAWHKHTNECPSHNGSICGASVKETGHGYYQTAGGEWVCHFTCSNGHNSMMEHGSPDCPYRETIYDCGNSPMNQWEYVCGKTTSTIESATIVFNN